MTAAAKTVQMYAIDQEPKRQAKEAIIPGGFYLMARCIQDSAIASAAPHVREIWHHLIKEANYEDRKTHGVIIKRGQLFTDYKEISDALSWKEGFIKKRYEKHHVDYAMRWLRQELMITTQKTTRGLIITVCNYETYQCPANYEKANDYDTVTTRLRQPTDTIQNELKNTNKEREGADAPMPIRKSFKNITDQEFRDELQSHLEKYGRETLNAFYKYWSEKSASGKMRFQLQQTWETKKRLEAWARRDTPPITGKTAPPVHTAPPLKTAAELQNANQ